MRAPEQTARPVIPFVTAFLIGFVMFLAGATLGHAQDTTVVHDRTGIFGPLVDYFFPVVVTFLTSLTVKIISAANAGFAKTSPAVKYVALYFFALLYNYLAHWTGWSPVDPTAPVFVLSAIQTGAAALIYRFGQHAVETAP